MRTRAKTLLASLALALSWPAPRPAAGEEGGARGQLAALAPRAPQAPPAAGRPLGLRKEDLSAWFLTSRNSPKAVVVLVHGLNVKPRRMTPLAALLTIQGADVLRLTLAGHEGDKRAFLSASRKRWLADIARGFSLAQERSRARGGVPVYFLGHSLGALLGADWLSSTPEGRVARLDAMVLLAPALAVRPEAGLARLFSSFPSLSIPSMNLKGYRAWEKTPIAAYNALFHSLVHWEGAEASRLNVPTLVFCDPQDELVSYGALASLIKERRLDNWSLGPLDNAGSTLTKKYHHLIIDEASLGSTRWAELGRALTLHFKL